MNANGRKFIRPVVPRNTQWMSGREIIRVYSRPLAVALLWFEFSRTRFHVCGRPPAPVRLLLIAIIDLMKLAL
jgi:hypothetical protein